MNSSSSNSSSSSMDSSSSSSWDYSSSSSSSSWNYSSSSSSSLSSSSSSMDSSSSSSSSYLDYHEARVMPFTLEIEQINPAWCITFYGSYAYVGTGSDGLVIRSSNRYTWESFYDTGDVNVTSLLAYGGYLYVGTSPKGKIFRINLSDNTVSDYGEFYTSIKTFVAFNNVVYAITGYPSYVLSYDSFYDKWNKIYEPSGNVQSARVIDSKMYIVSDVGYVVSYDGLTWNLADLGTDNIYSMRKVSKNPFSYTQFSFIDRSAIINTDGLDNETIYDIFPQDRSTGLSSIEQDGTSIVMGSMEWNRLYSCANSSSNARLLFDTDGGGVHCILNVNLGANLVSMGNKLYLVYSGPISNVSNAVSVTTAQNVISSVITADLNANKTVVMTYPNGGEQFQLGQEVTIQWSSTRNVNESIKLDLYKGGVFYQSINSQTANSGNYTWDVPISLPPGDDYKIYIEWLSAGGSTANDNDISDSSFLIATVTTTTTTTTTTARNPLTPDTSITSGIPVLVLPEYEYITAMANDDLSNSILLTTSTGRILETNEAVLNGYMTGNRTVYADVRDGFGYSNSSSTQFTYALYHKIAEINRDKEIVRWVFEEDPSAIATETITGVFTSPVLYVQEDLGFWKELRWTETKPDDTEVVISIKSATSSDALLSKDWEYSFVSVYGETGTIIRALNDLNLNGKYLQLKVSVTTNKYNTTPIVTSVSVLYSTKQASYFFTDRFSLENNANADRGLIVAKITEPQNTEVQLGICDTESVDWNNYEKVNPDRYFSLGGYENIKVGVRFVTYDDTHVPEVAEFALMFGSDIPSEVK